MGRMMCILNIRVEKRVLLRRSLPLHSIEWWPIVFLLSFSLRMHTARFTFSAKGLLYIDDRVYSFGSKRLSPLQRKKNKIAVHLSVIFH